MNFLDIIYRLSLNLKNDVSETGVCLRYQVKRAMLDPSEVWTSSIYWAQKVGFT
jgi:hypothetical protein